MKKSFTLISLLLILVSTAFTQVNGYAKVTSITGAVLSLSNGNETYGSFAAGQKVILIQMQDNVIGSNTNNNASFGNMGSAQSAGLYEILQVASVNRTGGVLNSITLTGTPGNTYHTSANAAVQLITYPTFGNPDYSTTANITTLPWDGNIGGVLAFNVNGTLTLRHTISASAKGFRGAAANGGGSADCGVATSYRTTSQDDYADKGEGIYKATDNNYAAGRGKILNGGGGANSHNAGGGGGGNYSAGGEGGPGWICSPGMGGLGGLSLAATATSNRVFMGGGGGSGEGNNGNPNNGGNGGGIILLHATTLRTTGSGDTLIISSNGANGLTSTNDGAGGAGAGGSIILMVNSWNIVASRPLLVTANGGNGGNIDYTDQHGGGGGGGQGVIFNVLSSFSANVAGLTRNGVGGFNNIGGTRAQGGSGQDNAGVIGMTVLPLKLISFTGMYKNFEPILNWKTVDEYNLDHFELQRSYDGINFSSVAAIPAKNAGDATYSFTDKASPAQKLVYYRLCMIDRDGKSDYSKTITISQDAHQATTIAVYPNPARDNVFLDINASQKGNLYVEIINADGITMIKRELPILAGANRISLPVAATLKSGLYVVRAVNEHIIFTTQLIKVE